MKDSLYPSLGRYFDNLTELAHAGCMSRRRLYDCLHGIKNFTRAEKKAIAANIAMKLEHEKLIDYSELTLASQAWEGKFDEIYKAKTA